MPQAAPSSTQAARAPARGRRGRRHVESQQRQVQPAGQLRVQRDGQRHPDNQGAGQVDEHRDAGLARVVPHALGQQRHHQRADCSGQGHRQAARKRVLTQQRLAEGGEPVSGHRFLEIIHAEQMRNHPAPALEHFPCDLGVARFIGYPQRAQAQRQQDEQEEQAHQSRRPGQDHACTPTQPSRPGSSPRCSRPAGNRSGLAGSKDPNGLKRMPRPGASLQQAAKFFGHDDSLDFGVHGVHIEAARTEAAEDVVGEGACGKLRTDDLVVGRQVHRDLRSAQAPVGQPRPEQGPAAAIAVVAEAERLLGLDHPLVGTPAGRRRALDRRPEDVLQGLHPAIDLCRKLPVTPAAGIALPRVVVPGVQAHLVSARARVPHQVAEFTADLAARPRRAGEHDVPTVQAGCTRAPHLPEESRPYESPQVTPHVVGADRKEEGRANAGCVQRFEQPRHAVAGAAPGVHIDAQAGVDHQLGAPAASCRKKSRVLPMVMGIAILASQSSRRLALATLGLRCATSW